MSQLAEYLGADLEYLLQENIKDSDDKWRGWLIVGKCDYLLKGKNPFINILLSYFALVKINEVVIQGSTQMIKEIQEYLSNYNIYKLEITYLEMEEKQSFRQKNTLFIEDTIFLYDTNLTRYFQRAMARKDGISVLVAEQKNTNKKLKVSYDKQNVIRIDKNSDKYMLPVVFCPAYLIPIFQREFFTLIKEKLVFAEPMPKGFINKIVYDVTDLEEVNKFLELVEKMME